MECVLCDRPLTDGESVVVTRGIGGLFSASQKRGDDLQEIFKKLVEDHSSIEVHVECR